MKEPTIIINLQKHKLGKFVEIELPQTQKVSQKRQLIEKRNKNTGS